MLLVVMKLPAVARASARAAAICGLTAADLGHRLQGVLPRVLLSDADGDRLAQLSDELDGLGFVSLTCDARLAPTDADRMEARSLRMEPHGLVAIDGAAGEHDCPWVAIESIQRGVRRTTQTIKDKTTERKFDAGRAILSGGIILTRKEEKVSVRKTETTEPFALVQRADGEPDIILYERRMDYRFLGRDMQPASRGNLELVVGRLRAAAPSAIYDDRVARPGFVTGLPATSADPVDLGLFLVTLALRRGAVGG
jgi:hypothetical protein